MSASSRGCVRTGSVWTPGEALAVCVGWGSSSTPHMESASVSIARTHVRTYARTHVNKPHVHAAGLGMKWGIWQTPDQNFLEPFELSLPKSVYITKASVYFSLVELHVSIITYCILLAYRHYWSHILPFFRYLLFYFFAILCNEIKIGYLALCL